MGVKIRPWRVKKVKIRTISGGGRNPPPPLTSPLSYQGLDSKYTSEEENNVYFFLKNYVKPPPRANPAYRPGGEAIEGRSTRPILGWLST